MPDLNEILVFTESKKKKLQCVFDQIVWFFLSLVYFFCFLAPQGPRILATMVSIAQQSSTIVWENYGKVKNLALQHE